MIYYFLIFVLSLLVIANVYLKNRLIILAILIFISISLILFAGLRLNVGFDYENYESMFSGVISGVDFFVEPLFLSFIYLFDYLNLGYTVFLFFIAFLSITIKVKFINIYSLIPVLSILLYFSRIFVISDFGQIRQGLALGFILFTYRPIIERKFKKFLLIVFCSSLIHAAAILFLPIYFAVDKKIERKSMFLIILIAFILATINLEAVLIQLFSSFLPAGLISKLLFYADNEEFIGLTFSMFLRGSIVLLCMTVYWNKIIDNKEWLVIFNIYYWGYIFYLIFNSLPQLGGRGSLYFQQFEILLFPLLVSITVNKIHQVIFVLFFIFYSVWGLKSTLDSQDVFIPYQYIFQK
jgi:hypothetical protein